MKLLLTNDDGIEAPGLAALESVFAEMADVTVVAPSEHLSGCGHQVNHHRPLMVREVSRRWHSVDGTPADCARLGLLHLLPEADWLLAGINEGANLGVDVYMSGTVAAAREAALLGKPGVALSVYRRDRSPVDWPVLVPYVARVFEQLRTRSLESAAFWNVNFPDPRDLAAAPQIIDCPLDPHHLEVCYEERDGQYHYRGIYHQRRRQQGSDVDVCFSGNISVTQVLPSGS